MTATWQSATARGSTLLARRLKNASISATLSGVVADTLGNIYGGLFVPGYNLICMIFEVTLEEWLPDQVS